MVVRDEQRVPVRRRRLERLRRQLAAGAGAVLHHHRRAQRILELLGQQARDGVGAGTGREADQQPDRRARLRLRQPDSGEQRPKDETAAQQAQGGAQAPPS